MLSAYSDTGVSGKELSMTKDSYVIVSWDGEEARLAVERRGLESEREVNELQNNLNRAVLIVAEQTTRLDAAMKCAEYLDMLLRDIDSLCDWEHYHDMRCAVATARGEECEEYDE